MEPETRYTSLDGDGIAYQVVGSGALDLVFTAGSFSGMDALWDDPGAALFLRRLASMSRLIRFDRLGIGASDRVPLEQLPPVERYADELLAVMDAVGSERAVIFAAIDAGPMAIVSAVSRPERVAGLLLAQTTARFTGAESYAGLAPDVIEAVTRALVEAWGTEDLAALNAPSRAGDERFRRWYARYSRSMASPRTVEAYARSLTAIDVRGHLERVAVPTVVLHRVGWPLVPIEQARYLAEHIDGATLVELPGSDGALFWEEPDLTIETVRSFLASLAAPRLERRRMLATILFTDIVDSTGRAAAMGDGAWRAVLDTHDEVVRSIVDMAGERVVKTTGDGVLAVFPDPGAAIASAERIRSEVRTLGLEIRAGLHTGEVEERGADVGGMGVHIASRVMSAADADEILVSRTVRDVVTGTDRRFQHRGERDLKGVDGAWELYELIASR